MSKPRFSKDIEQYLYFANERLSENLHIETGICACDVKPEFYSYSDGFSHVHILNKLDVYLSIVCYIYISYISI